LEALFNEDCSRLDCYSPSICKRHCVKFPWRPLAPESRLTIYKWMSSGNASLIPIMQRVSRRLMSKPGITGHSEPPITSPPPGHSQDNKLLYGRRYIEFDTLETGVNAKIQQPRLQPHVVSQSVVIMLEFMFTLTGARVYVYEITVIKLS